MIEQREAPEPVIETTKPKKKKLRKALPGICLANCRYDAVSTSYVLAFSLLNLNRFICMYRRVSTVEGGLGPKRNLIYWAVEFKDSAFKT